MNWKEKLQNAGTINFVRNNWSRQSGKTTAAVGMLVDNPIAIMFVRNQDSKRILQYNYFDMPSKIYKRVFIWGEPIHDIHTNLVVLDEIEQDIDVCKSTFYKEVIQQLILADDSIIQSFYTGTGNFNMAEIALPA